MPAYFEQGFMVREPAWHGLGEVLPDYPGREEAMRIAGHDFTVIEQPIYLGQYVEVEGGANDGAQVPTLPVGETEQVEGWKALTRDDTGKILHVAKDSYAVVQNETAWDIVDALVGEGALYETGITLKGGAVASVLARLDEPIEIPGDNSITLPFVSVSWSHDGSGSIQARPTSVRVVCWNTLSAAEAEGKRLGRDFTFRHSKNVMERIEDAKLALQGVRDEFEVYVELARELAGISVTPEQRELFVSSMIPMPDEALISDRVKSNVEEARKDLRSLFESESIPESHELTAYGLQLAGVEYLDHIRPARSPETKFGRSLLRSEPAKTKLNSLIREVVKS